MHIGHAYLYNSASYTCFILI